MGKSQTFNFDSIKDKHSNQDAFGSDNDPKANNIVIGPLGILLGILLVIALCVATGLIVYFLHPNHGLKCDDGHIDARPCTANITWEVCLNMSRERDECKYRFVLLGAKISKYSRFIFQLVRFFRIT